MTVILKFDNLPPQELKVNIHKSRDVVDLWKRSLSWLVDNYQFNVAESDRFSLLYKNRLLPKTHSLKEAGITDDTKVFV